MMIKDTSIEQFLEQLASQKPTPGGGSAAAVMGAMGAALVSMVCHLTIGKKGYEAFGAELSGVLVNAETLRGRLVDLIRADVDAFDAVMAAYRLPKVSHEEIAHRSEAIQGALKQATEVPLECAEACAGVIRLCRSVADYGNRNVITDAGVAVVAAEAALRSAALNVHVNVGSIRDGGFREDSLNRLEQLMAGLGPETEKVYQSVLAKL